MLAVTLSYMRVGTECYSVTSQNICYDIPARTRLGVPDPDSNMFVWISTAFRQSPAKVCFQQPQEACSTNSPVATLPSPSPPPPSIGNQFIAYLYACVCVVYC